MIYRFQNPFVSSHETEINTDTGEVWHIYKDGRRKRSDHSPQWWIRKMGLDDYEMDEGL